MAKNDLLTIGLLGLGAYVLYKGMSANAYEDTSGTGGYTYDTATAAPPVSPEPPATPSTSKSSANEVVTFSAPVISAETQAAIDAGTLNIFAQPQITTPPQAPFITSYNAKVAEAKARTGNANIAAPVNVIDQVLNKTKSGVMLPSTNQIIGGLINEAKAQKATAAANAAAQQSMVNKLDPGLASALGFTQTVSKASTSSSKATTSSATAVKATAPAPAPTSSAKYVYSRAQATSFAALNPKKKIG